MEKLEAIVAELQHKNACVHPVRPGRELCRNFRSFNACKFGNTCKNNHILPKFTDDIVVGEGQRFDVRISRIVELMSLLAVAIPGCKIDERYDDINGSNTHLDALIVFCNELEEIIGQIMAVEYGLDGAAILNYYDGHLQKIELFRYSIPLVRVAILDNLVRDNTFVDGVEKRPNASNRYKSIFSDIDGRMAKLCDDFNIHENLMTEAFYNTVYHVTNPVRRIYSPAAVETVQHQFIEQLSTLIQSLYDHEHALIGEIHPARESVQSHLQRVIEERIFPNTYPEIVAFGSSQSTFCSSKSDIDLSLSFRQSQNINLHPWAIDEAVYATLPTKVLHILSIELTKDTYSLREIVVNARVPVLKLKHIETGIDIDICNDNRNGVMNTNLLKKYADFDSRIRPLMFAVKSWCSRRGISDSTNCTLTSYGWNLLVIHFLQCHFILPYFTIKTTATEKEIILLDIEGVDEDTRSFNATLTVGDLFTQFFLYYGNQSIYSYNLTNDVVYVKDDSCRVKQCLQDVAGTLYLDKFPVKLSGQSYLSTIAWQLERKCQNRPLDTGSFVTSTVSKNAIYSWRICIEDPFEDYDVGKVIHKVTGSRHIMNELRRVVGLIMKFVVEIPSPGDSIDDIASAISSINIAESCDSTDTPQALANRFHNLLNEVNTNIPAIEFTCFGCGVVGHNLNLCPVAQARDACHICGEIGHFSKDCTRRRQAVSSVSCFICGRPGHRKADCPNKSLKKGNLFNGGGSSAGGGGRGKRK